MSELAKVSVVVPHYNRLDLVTQALATVRAQTYPAWELVFVDDCSREDPTPTILDFMKGCDARVIRLEKNGGASNARNTGIKAATGRFVAFLDSDDLWEPGKLAAQVEAAMARASPDSVICYTASEVFGEFGPITVVPKRGMEPAESPGDYIFVNGGFVQTSSLFIGRGLADSVGFDTRLQPHDDFLFFLQVMAAGADYIFIDQPLTRWRNDQRPDRLSGKAYNLVLNGQRFLDLAAPYLTKSARTAFIIRDMGLENLKYRPLWTLGHLVQGVAMGIVPPLYMAWQIVRRVLGPERFDRLKGREAPLVFGAEQRRPSSS